MHTIFQNKQYVTMRKFKTTHLANVWPCTQLMRHQLSHVHSPEARTAESALAMKASVSLRALGSRVPHFRLLKAFRFPLHLTFLQTTIHSLLLFVPHVKAFRFPHLTFLQKPPSAKFQTNLAPEFTLSRMALQKTLSRSICRCAGML